MDTEIKYYQLTYLLNPLLDEKGVIEISQKIKKWIEEKQGHIEEEKTTEQSLAYPIKKHQQAICSNLSFQLLPQLIKELHEQLKLESHILRYMIQKKPDQQLLAQQKVTGQIPLQTEPSKISDTEPKPTKKEPLEKSSSSPPQKEKVKLEELDKKLEEILNE
jgi:ribosomal protein S6